MRAVLWSFGRGDLVPHVEALRRDHDDVVVAVEGDVERWSALRSLRGAWCTPLPATPSLPSLEARVLALPARLGRFDTLYTDDAKALACARRFGLEARLFRPEAAASAPLPERTRALVVTRAQPFHRGHLTLIERGLQLADEVIVVVAAAECSHRARDPFSAGERLQLVHAGLGALKDRCWLIALPSPAWPACALRELALFVPPYQRVVANNPVLLEMAEELGKDAVQVARDGVSASGIRERLVAEGAGPWLAELVPPGSVERLTSLAPRCARIAAS